MNTLCQCLRLPLGFFTSQKPEHTGAIFWRSQASATELARKAAKRRLGWVQDLTGYLREYVEFPTINFPDFEIPQDPLRIVPDEIENIATALRKYWGLGEGPLPSVMMLLENNGVFVSRDDLYLPSLNGLSRWSSADKTPFCLVASSKNSAARTTMDLLHELGHLILHRELDERYVSVPLIHKLIETQAFAFAGAFALPAESFAADVYSLSLDSFIGLKSRWRVAIAAMVKRCQTLNMLGEAQSERMWKTISARGWRTEEPLDREIPIETPRLLARAIEILISEGILSKGDIAAALALPEIDIEDMVSLPRGTLSPSESNVVSMPQNTSQSPDRIGAGSVVSFRKKV